MTEDSLVYTNLLIFSPEVSPEGVIRMDEAVIPIECHYERSGVFLFVSIFKDLWATPVFQNVGLVSQEVQFDQFFTNANLDPIPVYPSCSGNLGV